MVKPRSSPSSVGWPIQCTCARRRRVAGRRRCRSASRRALGASPGASAPSPRRVSTTPRSERPQAAPGSRPRSSPARRLAHTISPCAVHQHDAVRRGVEDLAEPRLLALRLGVEPGVVHGELVLLEHLVEHRGQRGEVAARLHHVVDGAGVHRLHRDALVALPRGHHDGHADARPARSSPSTSRPFIFGRL